MKKVFVIYLLIISMILTICGCNKTQQAVETPTEETVAEVTAVEEVVDDTLEEPSEKEEEIEEDKSLIMYSFDCSIIEDSMFKEGLMWVKLHNDDIQDQRAVVNKNGEVVYSLADKGSDGSIVGTTQFRKGYSAYYYYKPGYSHDIIFPGFTIINSKGEEVLSESENNNYYYMGQADDGMYFFRKYVEATFDTDSYYTLCMTDASYNIIETDIIIDDEMDCIYDFYYLDEGFYFLTKDHDYEKGYYVDIDAKTMYKSEWFYDIDDWRSNRLSIIYIDDDSIMFYMDNTDDYSVFVVPISEFRNIGCNILYDSLKPYEIPLTYERREGQYFYPEYGSYTKWNGGTFWRSGRPFQDYMDINSNVVMIYPSFAEGVTYQCIIPFQEGWDYSTIELKGIDSKYYVTVVDSSGNVQYDPVVADLLGAYNGYSFVTLNDQIKVITPTGEIITLNDSLEYLIGAEFYYDEIYMSEDYLYYGGKYYCAEDGNVISSFRINCNENGYIVYISDTGEEIVNSDSKIDISEYKKKLKEEAELLEIEQQSETNSQTNSYSNDIQYSYVKDFYIEGKWKNVGTDTFGQAQEGAIIVFDGYNCNFFSPSDTYAFYESGDWYKLDCTSPFADTLSFTVKTIDENHINVFYGDTMVELERVN